MVETQKMRWTMPLLAAEERARLYRVRGGASPFRANNARGLLWRSSCEEHRLISRGSAKLLGYSASQILMPL